MDISRFIEWIEENQGRRDAHRLPSRCTSEVQCRFALLFPNPDLHSMPCQLDKIQPQDPYATESEVSRNQ